MLIAPFIRESVWVNLSLIDILYNHVDHSVWNLSNILKCYSIFVQHCHLHCFILYLFTLHHVRVRKRVRECVGLSRDKMLSNCSASVGCFTVNGRHSRHQQRVSLDGFSLGRGRGGAGVCYWRLCLFYVKLHVHGHVHLRCMLPDKHSHTAHVFSLFRW